VIKLVHSAGIGAALLCVAAVAACARDQKSTEDAGDVTSAASEFSDPREASDSVLNFGEYQVLHASDVRTLTLRHVLSVDLTRDANNIPSRINSIAFHGNRVYVLDVPSHKLRGYDRSGASLFAVGKWGRRDGEMTDPIALGVDGDTLLLLDVSHYPSISTYNLAGNYVGSRLSDYYDGGTVAFAALGDTTYVATIPHDTAHNVPYLLRALDRHGNIIARGCWIDPQYGTSAKRKGQLVMYAFSRLATAGDRIYCVQPLSPIVQVLTSSARLKGAFRMAPPFYRAPQDIPATLNERAMHAFESTFTAHFAIHPWKRGFLSVYYRYDTTQARDEYRLFACERPSDRSPRCAVALSPGTPLRILQPDTLVVAETSVDATGPHLNFYVIQ